MKNLFICIFAFFTVAANCQIIGNKEIKTKTFTLEEVYKVNVQMYAKVTIDMDEEAGITITGESNLLDQIGRNISNGVLTLDQKQWIEPTRDIIIKIGAPQLRELEMGTHDKTIVSNVRGDIFKIDVPIGEVVLDGNVSQLRVKSKMGNVDASNLLAESADIRIKSDGIVKVNVSQRVDCKLNEDATFVNINTSAQSSGCQSIVDARNAVNANIRFIDVKIKNNSLNRNHFVVVGPKPDGRRFSYGFPMMPYQSKKERWTTGTKIFKENSAGIRTLLVTLTEEDEGEIVKLFE